MIDAVDARTFDRPRDRPVPRVLVGATADGRDVERRFERMTLVVAIKPECEGCRAFLFSDLEELSAVDIVVVAAVGDDEWARARRPVVVAPAFLEALDVRWPPFYVLVSPDGPRAVTEGVVFGVAQVAAEIAPHLAGGVTAT